MHRIDLDIRPMPWATKVVIDGKDFPCERIVVDCDASHNQGTRVALTYYPIDESGSYHEPVTRMAGCLLDEEEYGRMAVMRDALHRLRNLASERVNGRGERFLPSAELAALLPEINAALGMESQ
jgi:hypothetical protein